MTSTNTTRQADGCTCARDAGNQPLLLSVSEAAELLGIHRATVYDLLATGQLRSTTLGRRRLIPRTALEAFVSALDHRAEREAAEQRALADGGGGLDGRSHQG